MDYIGTEIGLMGCWVWAWIMGMVWACGWIEKGKEKNKKREVRMDLVWAKEK